MRFLPIVILCLMALTSCEYFKQTEEVIPVARVNDTYLYEKDIEELITEGTTNEDSVLIVNNFINRWATQQLLIDQAQEEFLGIIVQAGTSA